MQTIRVQEQTRPAPSLNLVCSTCRYGIVRAVAPARCPMCGGEATWVHGPWRPFSQRRGVDSE